jgi:hypothetical protein
MEVSFMEQSTFQAQFYSSTCGDSRPNPLELLSFLSVTEQFDIKNPAPARARMRVIVRASIRIPKWGTSSIVRII